MWWSLRTLKCVKCNFRCYGYRGCSQLFFPSPSWPWSVIFHCIFELLSLSFCGLCTTSTIGGVINALHKLLLTFHCQSAQPICKTPLLKRNHLKSAERKPNTYFNCHRSQHLLVFRWKAKISYSPDHFVLYTNNSKKFKNCVLWTSRKIACN